MNNKIKNIYHYLKSKGIESNEIFDYILKEESQEEWLYDSLIDICIEYNVFDSTTYLDEVSVYDIGKSLAEFFAYDYDSMLEELLPKLPSKKLEDVLVYFAAEYGIDAVNEIDFD